VRLYWKVGHALLQAKQSGTDPFAAIESIIPWDAVTQSVTEAQTLTQSEDFDYLHRIGDGYTQIRRYAPAFLDALHMKAAPAARDILDAVATLKTLTASNARKVAGRLCEEAVGAPSLYRGNVSVSPSQQP
jgi:hypothetical protein